MPELVGAQNMRNGKVVDQVHAAHEHRTEQHDGTAAQKAEAEFVDRICAGSGRRLLQMGRRGGYYW
jgi:hypothetical protein